MKAAYCPIAVSTLGLFIFGPGCGASPTGEELQLDQITQEQTAKAASVQVTVKTNTVEAKIAPSFLGVSQEWWLGDLAADPVVRLLKRLSSFNTGPFMVRIGGSSADLLNTVPSQSAWTALNKLRTELGARFIINLNLAANDKELIKQQRDAALQNLPKESIVSFEIGNEPNYFSRQGYRGDDHLNKYPEELRDFALALECDKSRWCAGPAWGHINLEAKKLDWILKPTSHLLNLVTVHFYKNNAETYNDPQTLLDEASLQQSMSMVRGQVGVAKKYNLSVRIDESNPISSGGLAGVSDVFSGALWILDGALEIAKNGGVGVDFHQGSPKYAIFAFKNHPSTGAKILYAKPPYYGTLLLQHALAQSAQGDCVMLSKQVSGDAKVKVHPIQQGSELRIVLINKDGQQPADVTVTLDTNAYGDGTLTRLLAPALSAAKDITFGGIDYQGDNGATSGTATTEQVSRGWNNGNVTYTVSLPAGTAALLVSHK